ncbi:flagella basal body P-ring formation protein FlgA [Pseudacidobacterium ailaaui]|jgi:hypothetical protein|uniref:flagella basal body P-ring formation protein FlgA n=1 Tax=Pseudacidobacterium ailaaui TaxID=1382359 RepID=UPI00047CF0BD|nr:flagella basal body P-ring formation protein FlgA [Pseudacidobacterium ailaaui]
MRPGLFLLLLLTAFPVQGAECSVRHEGKAIIRYLSDGVLHRRWALVADCAHPERPWKLEEAATDLPTEGKESSTGGRSDPVVVRTGAKVVLVMSDAGSRVVLTVTALGPGQKGDLIHVRTELGAILQARVQSAGQVEFMNRPKWNHP